MMERMSELDEHDERVRDVIICIVTAPLVFLIGYILGMLSTKYF